MSRLNYTDGFFLRGWDDLLYILRGHMIELLNFDVLQPLDIDFKINSRAFFNFCMCGSRGG